MITKEQFMNGLIDYADHEVMPILPTSGKWGLGTMIVLAKKKANTVLDELITNPMIGALGLVDDNDHIDDKILIEALSESATKYGKMDVTIPVIGTLTFSVEDIEKLRKYMNGGM